jgi:hypothetical protein
MKLRINGKIVLATLMLCFLLWTMLTVTVYRFTHSAATETEMFLLLPRIITLQTELQGQ